ncbi:MAG: alkaline phosphatase [Myxococcota bacterium]
MSIDRRRFLKAGAAGAALAGLGVSGCAHPGASGTLPGASPFQHGVASGDPLSDRVILWTRVSPAAGRMDFAVPTRWTIALDPEARDVVGWGEVEATAERDFTVKVDARGLDPATSYYYFFEAEGFRSEMGRTRTLPEKDSSQMTRLRIGVVSCSNYPQGYFNAYRCLAEREDLDLIIHVGDYLYEYGNGQYGDGTSMGRVPEPIHEIVSLEDYRRRHATYKRDEDLQAAHAAYPWITGWDDHETANNSWKGGAQNHTERTDEEEGEGQWAERKLAAVRAYHEWMPVREIPTKHFRSFSFGGLADLVMLDTRLEGRDQQVASDDHEGAWDPQRSMLGEAQTRWLNEALSESSERDVAWRIVGQQVVFASLTNGEGDFNPDGWDGYRENRRQILDHIRDERIDNVVFLTGDVHSAWAMDVPPPRNLGEPYERADTRAARAVEFVCPAVSSPPLGRNRRARDLFADPENISPHIRFFDIENQGFILLDLTPERVRCEFIRTGPAQERSRDWQSTAILEAKSRTNHLVRLAETDCEEAAESGACGPRAARRG